MFGFWKLDRKLCKTFCTNDDDHIAMIYEQNTCDPQQTTDIINRPLITNIREK